MRGYSITYEVTLNKIGPKTDEVSKANYNLWEEDGGTCSIAPWELAKLRNGQCYRVKKQFLQQITYKGNLKKAGKPRN